MLADKSGKVVFDNEGEKVETQVLGDHLTCLRANPSNDKQVAFGSKDKTVQLWSLEADMSLTQLWQAKNVANDDLDLQVPIWDTDLTWLPLANAYSLAACTAYCDVREYDTRGKRKPVIDKKVQGDAESKDLR